LKVYSNSLYAYAMHKNVKRDSALHP
jgi:hypothetical protein